VVRDVWAILAQTRHPMDTEAAPDARPPRATSTLLPPPFPRPRTSRNASPAAPSLAGKPVPMTPAAQRAPSQLRCLGSAGTLQVWRPSRARIPEPGPRATPARHLLAIAKEARRWRSPGRSVLVQGGRVGLRSGDARCCGRAAARAVEGPGAVDVSARAFAGRRFARAAVSRRGRRSSARSARVSSRVRRRVRARGWKC
jgi:hypothetical protein